MLHQLVGLTRSRQISVSKPFNKFLHQVKFSVREFTGLTRAAKPTAEAYLTTLRTILKQLFPLD
jgi:hypothetical protein